MVIGHFAKHSSSSIVHVVFGCPLSRFQIIDKFWLRIYVYDQLNPGHSFVYTYNCHPELKAVDRRQVVYAM